ncbi:Cupin (modular protein) [Hyella patelloides LEGE 07179]|uniref:Cupin (Modular protein) n=1 Tax=Hyella patelloides LEGE 07179 TaxID=945734 RepID=A0A563VYS9_9CYAN|nr:cupin domain-containing protein [Hyella patelloides]VEP16576.1 Cupin (modular protein) [Hyella patelloides LEGE 07179]
MTSIFDLPSSLPNKELFEPLASAENIVIERIISTGQVTQPGEWYNQDKGEWVILLQGKASLTYEDQKQIKLTTGDYLFILAHQKHRVEYTSSEPPCIWLAVHGKMKYKLDKLLSDPKSELHTQFIDETVKSALVVSSCVSTLNIYWGFY